eukprot:GDKJ01043081.1.p1 GENE.GDKJ01043081.1~~GDKJ01043081.1.p1  ORF type:complete len:1723 (-),score=363.33 GDKJ01043081.1:255-4985(-)
MNKVNRIENFKFGDSITASADAEAIKTIKTSASFESVLQPHVNFIESAFENTVSEFSENSSVLKSRRLRSLSTLSANGEDDDIVDDAVWYRTMKAHNDLLSTVRRNIESIEGSVLGQLNMQLKSATPQQIVTALQKVETALKSNSYDPNGRGIEQPDFALSVSDLTNLETVLPRSFDARVDTHYTPTHPDGQSLSNCFSPDTVTNQGDCGSCAAHAFATEMTISACAANGGSFFRSPETKTLQTISPNHVMRCLHGERQLDKRKGKFSDQFVNSPCFGSQYLEFFEEKYPENNRLPLFSDEVGGHDRRAAGDTFFLTEKFLEKTNMKKNACQRTRANHPSERPHFCRLPPNFISNDFAKEECVPVDEEKAAAVLEDADTFKAPRSHLTQFLTLLKSVVYLRGAATVIVNAGSVFSSQLSALELKNPIPELESSSVLPMQQIPIVELNDGNLSTGLHASHSVVCIGWEYVEDKLVLLMQNSWGVAQGFNGLYRIYAEGHFLGGHIMTLSTSQVRVNQSRFAKHLVKDKSDVKNTISFSTPQFNGFALDHSKIHFELLEKTEKKKRKWRTSLDYLVKSPFNNYRRLDKVINKFFTLRSNFVYTLDIVEMGRTEPSGGKARELVLEYWNSIGYRLKTSVKVPYFSDTELKKVFFQIQRYADLPDDRKVFEAPKLMVEQKAKETKTKLTLEHEVVCVENVYDKDLDRSDANSFVELKQFIKSLCDQLSEVKTESEETISKMTTSSDVALTEMSQYSEEEALEFEEQRTFTFPIPGNHKYFTFLKVQINPHKILAVRQVDAGPRHFVFYYQLMCSFFDHENSKSIELPCQRLSVFSKSDDFTSPLPFTEEFTDFLDKQFGIHDAYLSFVRATTTDGELSAFLNFLAPSPIEATRTGLEIPSSQKILYPPLDLQEAMSGFQPRAEDQFVPPFSLIDIREKCEGFSPLFEKLIPVCQYFNLSLKKYALVLNPLVYILSDDSLAFTFKCVNPQTSEIAPDCHNMVLNDSIEGGGFAVLPVDKPFDQAWQGIQPDFHQPFVLRSSSSLTSDVTSVTADLYSGNNDYLETVKVSVPQIPHAVVKILAQKLSRENGGRHFSILELCKPKPGSLLEELVGSESRNVQFKQAFKVECSLLEKLPQSLSSLPFETDGSKLDVGSTSGWPYTGGSWSFSEKILYQSFEFASSIVIKNDSTNVQRSYFKLSCVDRSSSSSVTCRMRSCSFGLYNARKRMPYERNDSYECVIEGDMFFIKQNPDRNTALHADEALMLQFHLELSHSLRKSTLLVMKYEYLDPLFFVKTASLFNVQGSRSSKTKYIDLAEDCGSEFQRLSNPPIAPFCLSHAFVDNSDDETSVAFPSAYPIKKGSIKKVDSSFSIRVQKNRPVMLIQLHENVKLPKNTMKNLLVGVPFELLKKGVTHDESVHRSAALTPSFSSIDEVLNSVWNAELISRYFNIPLNKLALLLQLSQESGHSVTPLKNYLFFIPSISEAGNKVKTANIRVSEKTWRKYQKYDFQFKEKVVMPVWQDVKYQSALERRFGTKVFAGLPQNHINIRRMTSFNFREDFCDQQDGSDFLQEFLCQLEFVH